MLPNMQGKLMVYCKCMEQIYFRNVTVATTSFVLVFYVFHLDLPVDERVVTGFPQVPYKIYKSPALKLNVVCKTNRGKWFYPKWPQIFPASPTRLVQALKYNCLC
jgi:hypothetical protein